MTRADGVLQFRLSVGEVFPFMDGRHREMAMSIHKNKDTDILQRIEEALQCCGVCFFEAWTRP